VEVLRSLSDLAFLDSLRAGGRLALVPTMGALHEGHLHLVRRARELGPVAVSIFVNPALFGPDEDLERYPRDLERDLQLLAPLGVAAVFCPEVATMYGQQDGVAIRPGARADCLCGRSRPGHFAGVLTVVAKLFNLIRPTAAVFGRKDAQQCLVIAEMVDDLKFPIRLIDAPTVREADGLALSSRNAYLDEGQRRRARCLSRALRQARRAIDDGEREASRVIECLQAELADADGIEYADLRRVPDLTTMATVAGRILLAVAATVGRTRLIDNIVLEVGPAGQVREASLLND